MLFCYSRNKKKKIILDLAFFNADLERAYLYESFTSNYYRGREKGKARENINNFTSSVVQSHWIGSTVRFLIL